MAQADSLWFDLEVRDKITDELNRLIGRANELQKALVISMKGGYSLGLKEEYDNATKLQRAFERINESLKKIDAAKGIAGDPSRIQKLITMRRELIKMREELERLGEQMKNSPNAMKQSGLVGAYLGKLGFENAISQINTYTKAVTEASKADGTFGRDMMETFDQIGRKASVTSNIISQFTNQLKGTLSLYTAEKLLKNIIKIGGEFEVQHIALQSILGDLEQANTIFNQIKQLAVVSPFNFSELISYSKQIAAFNIPYEEMYDTTKRLADMSAGLGVDMGRLILAYGQVRSAAVLRGQELRQFTEAGIPMVQALADEFTRLNGRITTTGEVFELISKRAVPFEMVKKVMWDMTNEGGRFYNMQFTLSDTLTGKWSNLVDAWQIMLSEFARGESLLGGAMKTGVQWLTSLIESLNKAAPLITAVFGGFVGYNITKGLRTIATMGASIAEKRIVQAQKLNAIKIREKFIQGEINDLEMRNRLQKNAEINVWRAQLLAAGKISRMHLLQLDYSAKENQLLLQRLMLMNAISAKQAHMLMTGQKLQFVVSNIGGGMSGLMSAFGGWQGLLLTAGITALSAYVADWISRTNEINENTKQAFDSIKQHYDSLYNYLNENPIELGLNIWDDEKLKALIEQYRAKLREIEKNSAETQIVGIRDLAESQGGPSVSGRLREEVRLLRERLELINRSQEAAKRLAGAFDLAADELDKLNTESVYTNMQDFQNAMTEFEKRTRAWSVADYKDLADRLISIGDGAKASGRDLLDYEKTLSDLGQTIYKMINQGNSLKDVAYQVGSVLTKLRKIKNFEGLAGYLGEDVFDVFGLQSGAITKGFNERKGDFDRQLIGVYNVIKEKMKQENEDLATETGRHIFRQLSEQWMGAHQFSEGMQQYATLFWEQMMMEFGNNIQSETLPSIIADKMRAADKEGIIKRMIDEDDVSTPTQEKIKELYSAARESILAQYPELKTIVEATLGQSPLYIPTTVEASLRNNKEQLQQWQKDMNVYFKDKGLVVDIKPETTVKDIEKKVKDLHDEFQEQMDRSGGILIKLGFKLDKLPSSTGVPWIDKQIKEYLEGKAGEEKTEEVSKEKGIDISGKARKAEKQADEKLKKAKARLDEIKKIYTEYKKYRSVYKDDEKALGMIEQIFGIDHKEGTFIIRDYEKALKGVLDIINNKFNTDERKKLKLSVDLEVGEINLDKVKHDAEIAAKELQEYISKESEKWNLYKSLFEKTGSKEYASLAFQDGAIWDDLSRKFASTFEAEMAKSSLKIPDNVWDMSDTAAQNFFGESKELYDLWKKIVELIRSKYKEALNSGADAIKENMSYSEQTAALYAKYSKLIGDAIAVGNQDAVNALQKKFENELSQIDFDKLKDSINWDAVFGNMQVYTKKALVDVRSALKEYKKVLVNKNDLKQIKEISKAISNLDEAIAEKSNIFSGMADAMKSYEDAVLDLTEAEKKYRKAVEEYGEGSSQAEQALRNRNQAQQNKDNAESAMLKRTQAVFSKITSVVSGISALGKSGASLSEMGSVVGTLVSTLSKTNTGLGNLIAAIFSLMDAIGNDGKGFGENLIRNVGNGMYGLNEWNGLANTYRAIHGDNTLIGKFFAADAIRGNYTKEYDDMVESYEALKETWQDLISMKEKYLNEGWGTEAQAAGTEILRLIKISREAEVALAKERLSSGSSYYSHSYGYRMWKGSYKYEGKNWQDVAVEISRALGGIKFTSMEDMLDMSAEQLQWIKENYIGLWSQMDYKFQEHLENIISYGDKTKDVIEQMTEKLTGMKFSDMVSSYANALSDMSNSNEELADDLESRLKNAILNSMVENVYSDRINDLIEKARSFGQNDKKIYDETGRVVSEYTKAEWDAIKAESDALNADMTARRDMLKNLYGWTDDSSSTTTGNSIKAVSEQTADLLASYINTMRADVGENRIMNSIYYPQFLNSINQNNVIANAQLEQLKMVVQNTSRNANFVEEIRDILSRNVNGANKFHI